MKHYNLKTAFILICIFSILTISCKKSTSTDNTTVDQPTQARVQSTDASIVQGETDNVDDDVNNSSASSARFCGTGNVFTTAPILPDGIVSLPSPTAAAKITITYNGTLVGCRKRTGTLTIDLVNGNRWIDAGAVLKYTFTNFKVENVCTNKSIEINGERFVTNVSGGNLFKLHNGSVSLLTHQIRTGASGYQVTFTDSSGSKTAVWNVARRTSITYKATGNVGYYFEANGDSTYNGIPLTESWGYTRYGNPYQTVFTSTVKANTYCGLWKPTAGEIVHTISSTTITVDYGLNYLGNSVGTNDCPNFYKVSWMLGSGLHGSQLYIY